MRRLLDQLAAGGEIARAVLALNISKLPTEAAAILRAGSSLLFLLAQETGRAPDITPSVGCELAPCGIVSWPLVYGEEVLVRISVVVGGHLPAEAGESRIRLGVGRDDDAPTWTDPNSLEQARDTIARLMARVRRVGRSLT